MLAAVLKDFEDLQLMEVPTPEPGPGEVLVRIRSCGFCATDYKAIRGIRRNVEFPLIPGHEPSGVIAEIAKNAAPIATTHACRAHHPRNRFMPCIIPHRPTSPESAILPQYCPVKEEDRKDTTLTGKLGRQNLFQPT